ncbi:hypothetical protein AB6A40_011291 [Gnathostoma spinigerum]|uniref:AMP-dependent synthetase/ligase domain-containing protein n=1 Tax=Gnathostoma spinigerum TaxID=75299 RepID=A0ABD6EZJ8_9BILA
MEYSKELFSTQILEAARNFGGDVALKTWPEGKSMSFEELRKNAYKFSKLLQSYDVNKGEIVCVAIPNSIEYVITFLGCAIIGGAIAGFSPQSKKEEISTYLSRTKAKVLVVSEDSEIQHDSYGPKFKVL